MNFRVSTVSLRTRITILSAVAVGLAVTITALAVFMVLRSQLYDQLDEQLTSRATTVASALDDPDRLTGVAAELLGDARIGLLTDQAVMYTPDGGGQLPVGEPELAVARGEQSSSARSITVDGQRLRIIAVPAGAAAFVLGQSTDPVEGTLRDLRLLLLTIGLLGVVAAATAGYAVARAGLRPVAELTAATERVALTEDLTTIEVRTDDEIGRLSQSFNAMLASLHAARERERQLVADAGHELRTPLTSIRTNLDLLAQSETQGTALPFGERAALLSDVRQQIVELTHLVDDLMQLSRDRSAAENFQPVRLDEVVHRAVDRVRRRAPSVQFAVATEPWKVNGDLAALERAVTNLLDNAAKWSPPGGTIDVDLRYGRLAVADEGPGIAESERSRVFERFYRSAADRGRPGSGLGLAIVAQTAQQHGGTVAAASAPAPRGGALLTMQLPGGQPPPVVDS